MHAVKCFAKERGVGDFVICSWDWDACKGSISSIESFHGSVVLGSYMWDLRHALHTETEISDNHLGTERWGRLALWSHQVGTAWCQLRRISRPLSYNQLTQLEWACKNHIQVFGWCKSAYLHWQYRNYVLLHHLKIRNQAEHPFFSNYSAV